MVNPTFTMEPETLEALTQYAKDVEKNRSLVVRDLIKNLLRREGYLKEKLWKKTG